MKKYHLLIMLFFAIFAPWTADAQSMLFSENFDGITAGNNVLPNNWQSINADNSSNCAYYPCVYANSQQTVYAYSGLNCLHFHSSSSAQVSDPQPQYAILPEMTDLAGKQITLYAKGENVSSTFKIGTMSAPTDASTFTLIAEQTLTESYQPFEYIVPSTCTDSYLAIMIEAANSDRTINGVYIDDIVINEAPSCLPPTALNAANITDNSAQLSWTANSGETAWTVYYRKGTDENYTNVLAETNPYILQGLDAASDYQYYVVANCSASFQSEPSGVFEFTTACAVVAAMGFQENFDSYQVTSGLSAPTVRVLPTCWSAINTTTDYNSVYPTIYNSSDAYYSTPNSLKFYSYYYNGSTIYDPQPQYAIFPEMTDLAGKQITLYAKGENASSTFKIGTMSDPTDASTFTLIAEQTLTNFYPTDPFEYLVPATCSDSYLAIMIDAANTSRTTNGVYIDDIVIVEAPTCPKPTNLTVNSVTDQTAQLSWMSDATAWQICLNDDEDHLIAANMNSLFQLTGLTDGETYTAKVRANCGNDGYSQWSNEVSFTTLQACPAPTGLAVSGTTETQTTLTWTGTSDSYDVMYRTAAYVDGFFEEFSVPGVPDDWTIYKGLVNNVIGGTATLTTPPYGWSTNTYALGTYNMKVNISGSCNNWLVTPEVTLTNGSSLNFDLALTDYGNADPIEDPNAQADDRFVVLIYANNAWTILREWNNAGSAYVYNTIPNTGENVIIDLSAYNGQNVKIAFYGESTVEDGDNDLHIDNVGIGIAHVAGQWQTATQQLENTTYTLAGLTPKTFYEVKVISNCENATSRETDPFGFSTLCGVITVDAANPFFEGFEGSNFPPTCWTLGDDVSYGNGNDSYTNWVQWNSEAHTGRKSAFPNNGNAPVYLMMPNIQFADDAAVVQLTFWSYYHLNGNSNGSSVVLLNGESETELWTPNVDEIVSRTWYETTIDLTYYKDQPISLAFKYGGENPHSWFLDDVEVKTLYTYTKEIAPYDTNVYPTNGWHLIASPVVEPITPTAANGFLTNTYDLYRFNQTAESEWQNYKLHNSDENPFLLENGKGYLYANSGNNGNSPITLAFTGTPNIGSTQTVALDYSVDAQFVGVNLVGNPFPDTAYINRDFYTMNSDRTEIMTEASTNVAIPPMEGVFVIAAEEGEILTFSTTAFNGGQGALIALNLSQDRGVIDRAVIRFGEGHTLPKFQIRNNSTKVYIPMDNVDYAIVRSEGVGEMPVNFKAENNGTYMLSFTADEVTFNYLHLIDNKTGIDVDLLQTPSYTFNATTTDYTSRFRLVFSTGTQAESGTFAYFSNGNFVISNEGEATLQVVDVMGRILSNETINGSVSKAINIASGVYMLRLINGDNVKVQKIVVR